MKASVFGAVAVLALGLGFGVARAQTAPDNYLIQLDDTSPTGSVIGNTYKNGTLIQSVPFCCDTLDSPYFLWSGATLTSSFDNQFNYYDPGSTVLSDTIEVSGTAGNDFFTIAFSSAVDGGPALTPLPDGGTFFENGQFQEGIVSGVVSNGDFYNLEFASAVPEPATWALMLAGFAGLGAALRSKRKTALA
jgi:hypothetical protein